MSNENELFAKIPKELFYHVVKDKDDNSISIKDNSILTNIRDDKVILILYYLYLATGLEKEAITSLTILINKCNYYNNDKVKREFKIILGDLCKLKYISTNDDINKIKHNDAITFITEKLLNSSNFVILEKNELDKIKINTTSKKEMLNLLKVYLYLKSRCYNKEGTDYTARNGGKAQVTYCSYNNISEFTYISEGHIVKYIDKLKEIKLIDYRNLGRKTNNSNQITECNNVYIIKSICDEEIGDNELTEGLKQQRKYYEDHGYSIIETNNVCNKSIYGRKGYLTKKLNKNIITKEESIELELLNTNIEEYKLKYKKK